MVFQQFHNMVGNKSSTLQLPCAPWATGSACYGAPSSPWTPQSVVGRLQVVEPVDWFFGWLQLVQWPRNITLDCFLGKFLREFGGGVQGEGVTKEP